MVENKAKMGKNGQNDPKKGYPANFEAQYLKKQAVDPMFFLFNSIQLHPLLIVLEGEKILSHIKKLNKNPPNFPHELKFLPDAIAFTGTVKQ